MIITNDEKNFIEGILEGTFEYEMDEDSRTSVRQLLDRIKSDEQKTCPQCGQTVYNLYLDRNNETMCADCAIDLSIKVSRIM